MSDSLSEEFSVRARKMSVRAYDGSTKGLKRR